MTWAKQPIQSYRSPCRMVPDRLKTQLNEMAMTATIQALVVVKSHYPRVDLQCFEEGFTTDVDDAKLESLSLEVEHAAESLVENLNLDCL